jgi:nucleoside phosphorylase
MKKKETLIYCALMPEAKPLIGYLKLTQTKQGYFENESILLCVGGIGFEKTKNSLHSLFQEFHFQKAINLGIAGCKDETIPKGSLFCTNQELKDIAHTSLTSVLTPLTCKDMLKSTLVDMEAQVFLEICKQFLKKEDIFVFKVVSDYLDDTIPSKAYVNELIQKNIKKITPYV